MKQWLYCIQQQLNSACPTEMFMIYNSILFRFMSNTIRFINKSLLHIEDIEHVLVSQYGICSRHFLLMMTCSCVCLLAGVTNWLTVKCGVAELTRHNGERKMEGDCMILMMGHMDREVKYFFKNSPCNLDALKMCPLWLACKTARQFAYQRWKIQKFPDCKPGVKYVVQDRMILHEAESNACSVLMIQQESRQLTFILT